MTDGRDDRGIPKAFADKYDRQNRDDEAGFVRCDSFCQALKEPVTNEELRAALDHWKEHSFISGCSHGS